MSVARFFFQQKLGKNEFICSFGEWGVVKAIREIVARLSTYHSPLTTHQFTAQRAFDSRQTVT
jgi:hypothetical protein